jgi:hypothetical protein
MRAVQAFVGLPSVSFFSRTIRAGGAVTGAPGRGAYPRAAGVHPSDPSLCGRPCKSQRSSPFFFKREMPLSL